LAEKERKTTGEGKKKQRERPESAREILLDPTDSDCKQNQKRLGTCDAGERISLPAVPVSLATTIPPPNPLVH